MTHQGINQATLRRILSNLGATDFDHIVKATIEAFSGTSTLNVDGAHDSGRDLVDLATITGLARTRSIAAQLTVQQKGWRKKLETDVAKLGPHQHRIERHYFAVASELGRGPIEKAQDEVQARHGLHCTVLGSRELAGLISDYGLQEQLVALLDVSLPRQFRITGREKLLHLIASCSDEANEVRRTVHEDTLLSVLAQLGSASRVDVIHSARHLLGTDDARLAALDSALDSLLSRGAVKAAESGDLALSPETSKQMETASRLFDAELSALLGALGPLFSEKRVSSSDQLALAVLACQCHCACQLEALHDGPNSPAFPRLIRLPDSPKERLDRLLSRYYPQINGRRSAAGKIIDAASASSLALRLSRGYLYAYLEHGNALRAVRALGASSWTDVSAFVDASVVIPLICARLFGSVGGPFPEGSLACMTALQELGTVCFLAPSHLEECAAHLVKAFDFMPFSSQVDSLVHSQNGFVSHYARLVSEEQPRPASLRDFLQSVSPHAVNAALPIQQRIRLCGRDFAQLCNDYGLSTPSTRDLPSLGQVVAAWRNTLTKILAFRAREKSPILVEHDATVLAQVDAHSSGTGGASVPTILVTWDGVVVEAAYQHNVRFSAFTPHHLSDLVGSLENLERPRLVAAAVELAKADQSGARAVGDLIDVMVNKCGGQLRDWQLRASEAQLRDALRMRVANSALSLDDWISSDLEPLFRKMSDQNTIG